MAQQYATEFTPELSEKYLASMMEPINEQEEARKGEAANTSRAGGIGAQAETGSMIAGAETAAENERLGVTGKFGLDVAKAQHGERVTSEKEAFESNEAQKTRDFQEKMAEQGYQWQQDQAKLAKHQAEQGQLLGGALTIAGTAAGSIGGPIGAAVGANLGKMVGNALSPNSSGGESVSNPYGSVGADDEDNPILGMFEGAGEG